MLIFNWINTNKYSDYLLIKWLFTSWIQFTDMFTAAYYKEHIINNLPCALMTVTQITHLVHRRCVFSFTVKNK